MIRLLVASFGFWHINGQNQLSLEFNPVTIKRQFVKNNCCDDNCNSIDMETSSTQLVKGYLDLDNFYLQDLLYPMVQNNIDANESKFLCNSLSGGRNLTFIRDDRPKCCVKCTCYCAPEGDPNGPMEEGCCEHTSLCKASVGTLRLSIPFAYSCTEVDSKCVCNMTTNYVAIYEEDQDYPNILLVNNSFSPKVGLGFALNPPLDAKKQTIARQSTNPSSLPTSAPPTSAGPTLTPTSPTPPSPTPTGGPGNAPDGTGTGFDWDDRPFINVVFSCASLNGMCVTVQWTEFTTQGGEITETRLCVGQHCKENCQNGDPWLPVGIDGNNCVCQSVINRLEAECTVIDNI